VTTTSERRWRVMRVCTWWTRPMTVANWPIRISPIRATVERSMYVLG
jgi:hypothetical protein